MRSATPPRTQENDLELGSYLEELEFSTTERPDADAIKKRWKLLCKTHHPDHGGSEDKFKSITHAYKMLTDIAYRTKSKPLGTESLNITVQFPLRFEESYAGVRKVFSYTVTEIGPDGLPVCKDAETPLELETIVLDVPPGSFADDFTMKFPARGMRRGQDRGDVIFVPQRIPHPQFRAKRGAVQSRVWNSPVQKDCWDIESLTEVPLHTLLTGKTISVMTMRGMKKVKVPPGTTPGSSLRIDGLGCGGGAHLVVLGILYPDAKELKTKKWEKLGIDWGEGKDDAEETRLLEQFDNLKENTDG